MKSSKGKVLLLHRSSGLVKNASTIDQHLSSFIKYIDAPIFSIDTAFNSNNKLIKKLSKNDFSHIILHYSLFGYQPFGIPKFLFAFLQNLSGKKIAFFQDENQSCLERYRYINELGIDTIFSILHVDYHKETYLDNSNCKEVFSTLTGYVDEDFIVSSQKWVKDYKSRTVDVGYRARPLPIYLGKGGKEKTEIAEKFLKFSSKSNLKLDIKTSEESRLYGNDWNRFLGNIRCCLGVESGTSIFDVNGIIKNEMDEYLLKFPEAKEDEIWREVLQKYENQIAYRAISPRIFDSAIFKNLMIYYEGQYQGVMTPGVHFVELKKDFSNFDYVSKVISEESYYDEFTSRSYDDLILSQKYSYRNFIKDFCQKVDLKPIKNGETNKNSLEFFPSRGRKIVLGIYPYLTKPFKRNFYGRELIAKHVHNILNIRKDDLPDKTSASKK